MTRRRAMGSVLHNFLGSFTSRYSDMNGYWLFGQLVPELRELAIDLLADTEGPAASEIVRATIWRARETFRIQAARASLLGSVHEADVTIARQGGTVEALVNGHSKPGYEVTFVARAVVTGGSAFEAKASRQVAPHDPAIESCSVRHQGTLVGIRRIAAADVRMLWVDDYYDGPLSGAMLFRSRIHRFELVEETETARRYLLRVLSDADIEQETRWQSHFVTHVGDHWTMHEDGTRGSVRPGAEHANFYDAYAKRAPVDYTKRPIVGWVEL